MVSTFMIRYTTPTLLPLPSHPHPYSLPATPTNMTNSTQILHTLHSLFPPPCQTKITHTKSSFLKKCTAFSESGLQRPPPSLPPPLHCSLVGWQFHSPSTYSDRSQKCIQKMRPGEYDYRRRSFPISLSERILARRQQVGHEAVQNGGPPRDLLVQA